MAEPTIVEIEISEEAIAAELSDGRRISVPLSWSWRLSEATPQQRRNYRLIANGNRGPLAGPRRGHQRPWHASWHAREAAQRNGVANGKRRPLRTPGKGGVN